MTLYVCKSCTYRSDNKDDLIDHGREKTHTIIIYDDTRLKQ